MPRERQLARRRVDAHLRHSVAARRRIDKRRLGQVHLERDRLHLGVRQRPRLQIVENGQLIAAKDTIGKDVNLDEGEGARHPVQGSE